MACPAGVSPLSCGLWPLCLIVNGRHSQLKVADALRSAPKLLLRHARHLADGDGSQQPAAAAAAALAIQRCAWLLYTGCFTQLLAGFAAPQCWWLRSTHLLQPRPLEEEKQASVAGVVRQVCGSRSESTAACTSRELDLLMAFVKPSSCLLACLLLTPRCTDIACHCCSPHAAPFHRAAPLRGKHADNGAPCATQLVSVHKTWRSMQSRVGMHCVFKTVDRGWPRPATHVPLPTMALPVLPPPPVLSGSGRRSPASLHRGPALHRSNACLR